MQVTFKNHYLFLTLFDEPNSGRFPLNTLKQSSYDLSLSEKSQLDDVSGKRNVVEIASI